MLVNANTALLSFQILLVPYEPHHVLAYHGWMGDEEILKATASERLTLDEEYAMQKSWRDDNDKLTFIICLPLLASPPDSKVIAKIHDTPDRLVGDVNLFLDGEIDPESGKEKIRGEVELMIADKAQQGKGLGKEALLLFLGYILSNTDSIISARASTKDPILELLRVKINKVNLRSIKLFESVGFVKTQETPNFFEEFELVWEDPSFGRALELMSDNGMFYWAQLEYCHNEL